MSAATGTNIVGVPDVLRTITKSEYLSWVRRPVRTKKVTLWRLKSPLENSESLIPHGMFSPNLISLFLIKSRTVLPARRENFDVTTADGKRLVGELALPEGEIKATLVTFHPLPTHGGYMDSHVYKKASFRLPALANIAVLRFNTRGTSSIRGTSEGVFDGGFAEKKDFDAILKYAVERQLPNIWLIGWSFGTELVLKYAPKHASEFVGAILLSPPLHRVHPAELDEWNKISNPLYAFIPEFDDYLRPPKRASVLNQ